MLISLSMVARMSPERVQKKKYHIMWHINGFSMRVCSLLSLANKSPVFHSYPTEKGPLSTNVLFS